MTDTYNIDCTVTKQEASLTSAAALSSIASTAADPAVVPPSSMMMQSGKKARGNINITVHLNGPKLHHI